MSKMIKSEGKSQKKNLDIAISELAKIEKIQKQAAAVRFCIWTNIVSPADMLHIVGRIESLD